MYSHNSITYSHGQGRSLLDNWYFTEIVKFGQNCAISSKNRFYLNFLKVIGMMT